MRRRIRLTGRRQIPRSSVRVGLVGTQSGRLLTFSIVQPERFRSFPHDARIKIRLFENKSVTIVDLGTVSEHKSIAEGDGFAALVAPTCQLRVVDAGVRNGLLLGTTNPWTLVDAEDNERGGRRSLLNFQPADTAPRAWRLEIREDDHPIIKVDKRIPNARHWARTDRIFLAVALPSVLGEVLRDIVFRSDPEDVEWMSDWLKFANLLSPGNIPPLKGEDGEKKQWIDAIVDAFCQKNAFASLLLDKLSREGGPA